MDKKEYYKIYYQKNKSKYKIYSAKSLANRSNESKARAEEKARLYNIENKENTKKRTEINRKYIEEYLDTHICLICGEKDHSCLEFHHRDPEQKKDLVSRFIHRSKLESMKKEIEKCDVLCCNCHIRLHNKANEKTIEEMGSGKEFKYRRQRRRKFLYAIDIKKSNPCSCGESDPSCLVFHHRNAEEKELAISELYDKSWDKLKSEIEKCDVMCVNCHRKLHYKIREENKVVSPL